ncbi:MAG: hypothetical protein PHE02_02070 [Lachnospiraceae bacterium]|nr:hypothetical protein [Lachnospiraceae bacterium]
MSGYVIKVTIENLHPPVWRRIIIPERITFEDLHDVLQIAFGWENDHMHDFSLPDEEKRIGMDLKRCYLKSKQ